jgi:hypothetical protein
MRCAARGRAQRGPTGHEQSGGIQMSFPNLQQVTVMKPAHLRKPGPIDDQHRERRCARRTKPRTRSGLYVWHCWNDRHGPGRASTL